MKIAKSSGKGWRNVWVLNPFCLHYPAPPEIPPGNTHHVTGN